MGNLMNVFNKRISWNDDLESFRKVFIEILNDYFGESGYVAISTSAKNEYRINIETNCGEILISMWPKKRSQSFDFWIHTEVYNRKGKQNLLPENEVFIRDNLTGWRKFKIVYPQEAFKIIESLNGLDKNT